MRKDMAFRCPAIQVKEVLLVDWSRSLDHLDLHISLVEFRHASWLCTSPWSVRFFLWIFNVNFVFLSLQVFAASGKEKERKNWKTLMEETPCGHAARETEEERTCLAKISPTKRHRCSGIITFRKGVSCFFWLLCKTNIIQMLVVYGFFCIKTALNNLAYLKGSAKLLGTLSTKIFAGKHVAVT